MPAGPIICLIFLSILFLLYNYSTKQRKREYIDLIEKTKEDIVLYVEHTETYTLASGLNPRNLQFSHCDLYVMHNAIIVLGFSKRGFITELTIPIILTAEIKEFSTKFPYAFVKNINTIEFINDRIRFNVGDKGLLKSNVDIEFNKLNETERNTIQQIIEQNHWQTN